MIIAASSIPAALLGWRIVALDPGNVVGRRLVWLGLALTWVWVPIGLLELGAVKLDEPDALWVRILAIVNANHHVPLYLTLLAVVMVFPDGRAPSPAWRRRALAWNWFFAAALAFSLLDGGDLTIIGASGRAGDRQPAARVEAGGRSPVGCSCSSCSASWWRPRSRSAAASSARPASSGYSFRG